MARLKKILTCLIAVLCLCSTPMNNGSEVTNGHVMGKVVYTDGSAAIGVSVMLVRDTLNPLMFSKPNAFDTTTTNNGGYYSFPSISDGWYNVLASDVKKKGYLDSIYINQEDTIRIKDIVLQTPVSCKGIVHLQNHEQDNQSAIVLVLGTNTYASPKDSAGNFTLPSLAAGNYRLRVLSTIPDYEVKDTTIQIKADSPNELTRPIELKFIGIPQVGPLSIAYNGLMKMATISWPKLDTSTVKSYNIYCKLPSGSTPLFTETKSDTFTVSDLFDKLGDTVIYTVSAVNHSTQEGEFSTPCTLLVADSLVCIHSTKISGIDSLSDPFNKAITYDQAGNIYFAIDNKLTKFDENGQLLKSYSDTTPISAQELYITQDGMVICFEAWSMRMFRLSNELSLIASIDLRTAFSPTDTNVANIGFSLDNAGNLVLTGSLSINPETTNIVQYSPTFMRLNSYSIDGIFNGFQWNRDSWMARDGSSSIVQLTIFNSDFIKIGPWDLETNVKNNWTESKNFQAVQYCSGRNAWLAATYIKKNGMTVYNQGNNCPTCSKAIVVFDQNRKMIVRSHITGQLLDIDKEGLLHVFSGNTFSTYQVR